MKIVNAEHTAVFTNPHGVDARKIHDTKHAQVILITLKPGESLKKHVTPVDVFFFVLEGRGVVEIGDESAEVESGCLVESPARIPHLWRNDGGNLFKVLVVKTPHPRKTE